MNDLKFAGKIVNGIGKHAELVIPGCNILPMAPADWPEQLYPGSLNLSVSQYPDEFTARGLQPSTKALDMAGFEPEFTIRQNLMLNNRLTATETMPNRGTAQVWRASLKVIDREVSCWVLRRFGSTLANQIELISPIGLRGELGLSHEQEWSAVVTMFGRWQNSE
jgi:CTP-dependent riboflavin kinase